ncbi:hypothetical protein [Dendronalium sp. ChiSLP03b]|uniref:hypothetical protein n=1 Tax=Dendronalium sp. ChiSLP03b TaxID=3075381 RepID=UPI002AD46AD2|nr:hypothetical protein [Dendronalium sp. ChiSLP03b]MDZ8204624.1 hypothetical protein [Dendronalium sp. ChiSLP03b]
MYVDEDLLSFSSYLMEYFSQGIVKFRNLQIYIDSISYIDPLNLAYAFLHGITLNLPAINDIHNKHESKELERSELISELINWSNKSSEIQITEQKIRKTLSQRYGKEFFAFW